MPEDFVIARSPEEGTTLPYLLRIPLGPDGIVLKAKETSRTGTVYCHRAVGWPAEPEIVEQVPVRSCVSRGASIDLVLDRGRENRSQFSRDLPLETTVELVAPAISGPLTMHSTIGEWLEQPEAGAALTDALGDFGTLFGPDSEDPAMAAFMTSMPVIKVPMMGMSDELSLEDLEALVDRYGA
ncbi:hypothetical protein [Ornithinimicrobium ciconiae]|uniref:hypothetical protein n=1 Tax=Ornithinimicrobium ciconiae TaxID=2594265 RepID=UPI00192DF462|nr:hypothetical protein [Ornithinimicrobium ciconiae]